MTLSIGWDPSKLACLANIYRKTWKGDYNMLTAIRNTQYQEHAASVLFALPEILKPCPLSEQIYKEKLSWNEDYGKNRDGTKRICLNDRNIGIIPTNTDKPNINNVNSTSDKDDNVPTPSNVISTDNIDGKSTEIQGSTPPTEGGYQHFWIFR